MNDSETVWPFDEIVPSEHCHDSNNEYLALVRGQQAPGAVSRPQRWVIDFRDEEIPKAAGNHAATPVYATICDAFLSNPQDFLSGKYVFRGHSNCSWGLVPTKRRIKTQRSTDFFEACETQFSSSVQNLFDANYKPIELEALCQHYGIPTDLLDFTEHFEVAAYFAQAKKSCDGVGCIWAFERAALERTGRFIHYAQISPRKGPNQRIVRQGGCFVRVETDDVANHILSLGTPYLFSQFTQSRQVFWIKDCRISESYLFPPDFDDQAASRAVDILSECKSMLPIVTAWENCNRQYGVERKIFAKGFASIAAANLPDSIDNWLCQPENARVPYCFLCIEELVWFSDLTRMKNFLSYCGAFNDPDTWARKMDEAWQRLLLEATLRKLSLLHKITQEEADAFWQLITLVVKLGFGDAIDRILGLALDSTSEFFQERFRHQRRALAEVVSNKLLTFPLELHEAKGLKSWYWSEIETDIQAIIRRLLDEYYESDWNSRGVLNDWPPVLPRLRVVREKWTFQSNVMIWDIDLSPKGDRIVAASSDCNVYVLDLNGNIKARCEMPCEVTKARFVRDDLVIANGRAGKIYGIKLIAKEDGFDFFAIHFQPPLCDPLPDVYGVVTNFATAPEGDCVLACYGNPNHELGGIACIDFSGFVRWNRRLYEAVLDIAANPHAKIEESASIWAIATTLTQDKKWAAIGIFSDGNSRQFLCDAELLGIAGLSFNGEPILSVTFDKKRFRLISMTWEGQSLWELDTDGVSISALTLQDGTIIAGASRIDRASKHLEPSVSAWRNGIRIWHCPMEGQVFRLAADPESELLLVSTMGQGNVLAILMNGSPVSCANVKLAPVAFKFNIPSNQVFVGSNQLTGFCRADFLSDITPFREATCAICRGNGRCHICEGRGRLPSMKPLRIDHSDDFEGGFGALYSQHNPVKFGPTCPICFGKRMCIRCEGTGRLKLAKLPVTGIDGAVAQLKHVLLGEPWKEFRTKTKDEANFDALTLEDTSVANRSAAISLLDSIGDADVEEFRRIIAFIGNRRAADLGQYIYKRSAQGASRGQIAKLIIKLMERQLIAIHVATERHSSFVILKQTRSEPGRLLSAVLSLLN